MDDHPCTLGVFCSELKVRLSIFIIIGACAGLPALVWSVSDLFHHWKKGHIISIFIILLLLTHFVELLLSPYILLKYLIDDIPCKDGACWVLLRLWWSTRGFGILLNQLVALDGLLSVKCPRNTACVLFSLCFSILYIVVLLLVFTCALFLSPNPIVPFVLVVSFITWIISCGVLCSAERHSHTSRKPDYHILAVFIYTLLVMVLCLLVVLNLLLSFVLPFDNTFFFISYCLISLRLISDPLLCVLVCRQNIRIQTSQTSEEIVWFEEV